MVVTGHWVFRCGQAVGCCTQAVTVTGHWVHTVAHSVMVGGHTVDATGQVVWTTAGQVVGTVLGGHSVCWIGHCVCWAVVGQTVVMPGVRVGPQAVPSGGHRVCWSGHCVLCCGHLVGSCVQAVAVVFGHWVHV